MYLQCNETSTAKGARWALLTWAGRRMLDSWGNKTPGNQWRVVALSFSSARADLKVGATLGKQKARQSGKQQAIGTAEGRVVIGQSLSTAIFDPQVGGATLLTPSPGPPPDELHRDGGPRIMKGRPLPQRGEGWNLQGDGTGIRVRGTGQENQAQNRDEETN
jgi:hypothetical protein